MHAHKSERPVGKCEVQLAGGHDVYRAVHERDCVAAHRNAAEGCEYKRGNQKDICDGQRYSVCSISALEKRLIPLIIEDMVAYHCHGHSDAKPLVEPVACDL